ncbi:MAG: lipocalin-like domain-containing protein [Muribaculaceae bacterium]|nr:lipocalin-like domain-containing protein [Muribaculaceae bacterium]
MKKSLLYISLMMVMLALGSCTRNHGDIGPWFGTWHVESITVGGASVATDGDYFFQFQNKVFRVSEVTDHEQLVESFGTWDEGDDGTMTVIFPDPDVFYITMPGLEANNTFDVSFTSSHEVIFTKTTTTGHLYTYHLKKQP